MAEGWLNGIATRLGTRPLGTVLAVGPTGAGLLVGLPQDAAPRVILTEADPIQAQKLRRRHDGNPAVTVVEAAITAAPGPVTLHRFNLPQAAALRPASGLKTLFPGLRETGGIEVPTRTIAALLEMSDLAAGKEHVLILGTAGEELALIEALIARDALLRFDHVFVPLPSVPLYAGSADGAAIRARLEDAAFRIASQDLSDPDLPFAYMRLNRDRLAVIDERRRSKAAQEAATAQVAEITAERDAAQADRHRAEAEIAALQDRTDRTQTLVQTYRHAIGLELQAPKGTSGAVRTRSAAALRLLAALDDLPASARRACLAAPAFNLGTFKASADKAAASARSHIVLDVKSVPRSGLHYMKRQFSTILQEGYSFCEWYQEPGCCKRMPCVHVSQGGTGGLGSLRMLKSHDFDGKDPVYPVTPGMQRLILTRDPLYVMTSQWLLSLLGRNKDLLRANDIQIEKIYYLHEPAVLAEAYAALEEAQIAPGEDEIARWLAQEQAYLLAFSDKWGTAAASMARTYIVPYDKTPLAVAHCLAPIRQALSDDQRARLDTHVAQWKTSFTPRSDPFKGPTPYLTTLLQRHAALFRDAAETVRATETGGLFGEATVDSPENGKVIS